MTDTTTIKGSLDRRFVVERQGRTFILFQGLLDLAHQNGLKRVTTQLCQIADETNGQTWIFRAEVETDKGVFSAYADANPGNVSRQMLTAACRMAETRSLARALRFAVNCGMTALDELGPDGAISDDEPDQPPPMARQSRNAEEPTETRQPRTQPAAPSGVTRTNEGSPASEKQINACYGIGKACGWNSEQTSSQILKRWGFIPEELSSRQAAEAITWLNTQKLRGPQ